MRRRAGLTLAALAAAVGAAGLSSGALAEGPRPACGAPGRPPCPLQAWMRAHVAAPLARRDLTKLAESLDGLRALNPDRARWANWERFANEGARAAREGDASKAQQSCTRCHDVYRTRYNEQFRERAVPDAGAGAR